ncbi:MAG: ferritin [Planctomycetota bacterium]
MMLISDKMCKKLNKQVTNEFYASHLYLAMACAFNSQGLKVFSKRFFMQTEEERQHALKIAKYILDVHGEVALEGLREPSCDCSSARTMVKAALDHELLVTKQINELVGLAQEENDHATRSFLQWFVDEQVEEVGNMADLLQLMEMAGDEHILQVEVHLAQSMQAS